MTADASVPRETPPEQPAEPADRHGDGGGVETEPATATTVFRDIAGARRFVSLLAGDGVARGVIGPRERARLWSRHVMNSGVVAEACPHGALVVDLGSGGGLPGVPLALARPDLEVVLLEPLLRRVTWLEHVVDDLGLAPRVQIVRARAEEASVRADIVVSRAVAPLSRLLPWSAGLARPGGTVVALKGHRAQEELSDVADRLVGWGLRAGRVARFGAGLLADPTTAVLADRERGGDRDITSVPGPAGRSRGAVRRTSRVAGRRRST